jgi:tight adherence protein B
VSAIAAATLASGAVLLGHWGLRRSRRANLTRSLIPPSAVVHRSSAPRWRALPAAAIVAVAAFGLAGVTGVVVLTAAALGTHAVRVRRGRRRLRIAIEEQLADASGALSAAVRAGMSVSQSLAYAADEASEPLGPTLTRLVADLDVGVPLLDAIEAWAEGIGTDDAYLLSGALGLHRRSGGELPQVLDQVAITIRERVAAVREVRALTAQARLSGLILGLLPVAFFCFLWLTSRRDIEGALSTTLGAGCVLLGLILEGLAFVWIRAILEVA